LSSSTSSPGAACGLAQNHGRVRAPGRSAATTATDATRAALKRRAFLVLPACHARSDESSLICPQNGAMASVRNRNQMLAQMQPVLRPGCYVFTTTTATVTPRNVRPIMTFTEDEGLTMIVDQRQADAARLHYDLVTAWITLQVHSALDGVGLTAAVSAVLPENAKRGRRTLDPIPRRPCLGMNFRGHILVWPHGCTNRSLLGQARSDERSHAGVGGGPSPITTTNGRLRVRLPVESLSHNHLTVSESA
jgi:hypothetical protein